MSVNQSMATNQFLLNYSMRFLAVAFIIFTLFFTSLVKAEGSKEFVDFEEAAGGTGRWSLEFTTSSFFGPFAYRTIIFAYVGAGEEIALGSSGVGVDSGNIYVFPVGHQVGGGIGAVPNFGTEAIFDCIGDAAGTGQLTTRAQEIAGPLPAAGGYTPCVFTPPAAGIYPIVFRGPKLNTSTGSGGSTGAPNIGSSQNSSVSIWDVSVRNQASLAPVAGRAYTNALFGREVVTGGGPDLRTYIHTFDGVLYEASINDFDGAFFNFFSNNEGVTQSGVRVYASTTRADIGGSGTSTVHDPEDLDTASSITNKMFFNIPNPAVFNATDGLGVDGWSATPSISVPTVLDYLFDGAAGGGGIGYSIAGPGVFTFTSEVADDGTQFAIIIDIDQNDSYDDAIDTLLIGTFNSAGNSVAFDGNDGLGNPLLTNILYNTRLYKLGGESHFPLIDVENIDGLTIKRLSDPTGPFVTVGYYNDFHLGSGVARTNASPTANLSGSNSGPYPSTFRGWSSGTGDQDVIDTWTFFPSEVLTNTIIIGVPVIDYGDAPDSYGTLAGSSGANHAIVAGLHLGIIPPDVDNNGFGDGVDANGTASDDDTAGDPMGGVDDEDAFGIFPVLTTSDSTYTLSNIPLTNSVAAANLVGWIDFNGNGVFDSAEAATAVVANGATSVNLTWSSLPGIVTGTTFARFRLTTDITIATGTASTSSPLGVASDGEVEDYQITITPAPIDAIDDSATGVNGITGGSGVLNVLGNDTLNGVAVIPGDVALTETVADPNGALTLNADGTVDVAAGTPAGTYQLTYQICENLNPGNCDTAVASVTVDPAPIDAIDDSATGVNGTTGGSGVLNVLGNDTLNGVAVIPANITLTQTVADPSGALTLNADGTVDVAAGTPAGTYQLTYQICENLNPGNCDTAIASVTVDPAPIDAIDDSATGVNGTTGGSGVLNVLGNDTLNGVAVISGNITLTETVADPNGALTLNADGTVDVAAGTPAGTYQLTYQICENLNPGNCDTAIASVTVDPAPIDAIDDSATGVNGTTGSSGVINVLDNDTLNGVAVTPGDVTLTETVADPTGALTLNTDGTVDVAAGTPAGTYQLTYQICEVLNPTNCDTATVSITVDPASINANDDTGGPVNGLDGATAVIDIYTNDTLGSAPVNAADITLSEAVADPTGALTLNADGTVDVAAGTPAGSYQLTYEICENLNPANCDTGIASITVTAAPIDAIDDSITGVSGSTGATGIIDVFGNDTLNGSAVSPGDVTLTETVADPSGALTLNADGTVDVAAGTPAGVYELSYEICENLNPANCDSAVVSVTVDAAPLSASDDTGGPVNGLDGSSAAVDIFSNDTLNGSAVSPGDVTLTETVADPSGALTLNADGTVDVAAGTPAGNYQLSYQLCEVLNPANCDTAVVDISVDAAPIDAIDDNIVGVNGITGASAVLDVFGNDTLNGSPVNPTDVVLTETVADPAGALTLNADGTIDVAAGTPEGSYQLSYQICEVLNPANCDSAVAVVSVGAAPINAVSDSASGVNGTTGGSGVINVLGNDTLDGAIVIPANISLTETVADPAGALTLNTDGTVDVAAGTPAGTYELTYEICEVLNPGNCDTAVASVTVDPAPIDAIDDSVTGVNGTTGGSGVINVLGNDTLNGVAVTPGDVTLTETVADPTGALTLNADGTVDVAAGTPAGTYQLTYQICEVLNPANCDTATVSITVDSSPVDAIDDSVTGVNGTTGGSGVLNVLGNDTLNGSAVTPGDVTLTETVADPAGVLTLNADGTVDVAAGTPAGIYELTYQICEVLNPANCDTATASITVGASSVSAVGDSVTGVNGITGGNGVLNVLGNDILNGVAVDPSDVTLTLTVADPNGALTLNADGTVDVAAGTPAGIYQLTYQICEVLNPSNCAIATVTISVGAVAIIAVDDSVSGINGTGGASNVLNVLDNDILGGGFVNPAGITLTETVADPTGALTLNADGSIDVAPGTPAGIYELTYEICDNLNPTSCDTAVISVTVNEAPIAVDDSVSNSVAGTPTVISVLDNDNGAGSSLDPATIQILGTSRPGESLIILGEGEWTIDLGAGTITFTPETGFTGDPAPIGYTVDSGAGITSNVATITITFGQSPILPGEPVRPIPTLSEWARILLGLLLGLVALSSGRKSLVKP